MIVEISLYMVLWKIFELDFEKPPDRSNKAYKIVFFMKYVPKKIQVEPS